MAPHRVRLQVECLEEREVPAVAAAPTESFDQLQTATLPPGWSQWSSDASTSFKVTAAKSFSGANGLEVTSASNISSRTWLNSAQASDAGVQATILADSLAPIQVFARGKSLDSATPTFYAASVTRGLQIDLIRVVDGVSTTLATLKSRDYVSSQWITVRLDVTGNQLAVQIYRTDLGKYLNASGEWGQLPVVALQATDGTIGSAGQVGISRQARYAGTVVLDNFTVIAPSNNAAISETFNAAPAGAIPTGWTRWSTDGIVGFGASTARAIDQQGLRSTGPSTRGSRAWVNDPMPADVQAAADIYIDSLVPGQVFVRGSNLDSNAPSYYALTVTRGFTISIQRLVNGQTQTLAQLTSKAYLSSQWLRVSLTVQGTQLQARVQRLDTGAWLNVWGDWQEDPATALNADDAAISGSGRVGLARPASYAGSVSFDHFTARPSTDDISAPVLKITGPASATLSGPVTIAVSASDASGIRQVEYIVDDLLVAIGQAAPFDWALDTRNFVNGTHRLTVRAHDQAGNVSESSGLFTFANPTLPTPMIPQHYSHIRIAALAYSGNPMGSFEKQLLQNSIDLVVPNPTYLGAIQQTASDTPQLIYSNASNIYQDSLTDWLRYADEHGVSRELAFYHVAESTPFSGQSASAQPVNWFWNTERGPITGTTGYTRLTSESRGTQAAKVTFGAADQAIYLGYTEAFREINFTLSQGKQAGWSSLVEYATAVDAAGNPTAWKQLNLLSDTTNGLGQSGQVTFDPPKDWVTAVIPGSTASLYYLRVRTLTGSASAAPIASSILGRDYVNAKGAAAGLIPAFDYAADKDGDGYLNNAEFANRRAGNEARFAYESRLFYPYYGQMRFVTDPSQLAVRDWAADYHLRLLNANPLADGIFLDNSSGKNPVDTYHLIEVSDTYAADFSAMLATINRKIAPRWLLANTSNGGAGTDAVVRQAAGTMEEFAIRALSSTWSKFNDLADTVSERQQQTEPAGYMVIDSLSTGGSPTDARTRIATLSAYYLIGNPHTTMLMLWGGEEPSSTWSRHWFDALTYNIGEPTGDFSLFATGKDPANTALTYNVYQRQYDSALVLYKPLSYALGAGSGTTANDSATTHQLGGSYRILNADGSLSAPVTSITLRNGEGAILVK